MSQQSGIFIANSSNNGPIPRPSANNLAYFLNANDGDKLYAMRSNGAIFPVPVLAIANDYANDAAAAAGGIILGGLYHTTGAVKIRLV